MAGAPTPSGHVSEGGWVKSSFSSGSGACVETKRAHAVVAVRDSKNPSAGHLSFPVPTWTSFLPR